MICYAEKRFFEWYEDDLSVSLRASGGSYGGGSEVLIVDEFNGVPSLDPVCLDNHPNDSRITIREDGIVQSLTSRCGTGGNNVPLVMIIKN